jgi:SAM-dependent methyltransferase
MTHHSEQRRQIVREKPFLRAVYREWYTMVKEALGDARGSVLEIGSGPGFLEELIPDLIRSDIVFDSTLHVAVDAAALPYASSTLAGIAGINVFHHLPHPRGFLDEASRCLKPGGHLVLLEPWATPWSAFCMRMFHNERYEPNAAWECVSPGRPLEEANNALAWIVFQRDRSTFVREFPALGVRRVRPMMPVRYLLSGGISRPFSAPLWTYGGTKLAEGFLQPLMPLLAMFALIDIERRPDPQ